MQIKQIFMRDKLTFRFMRWLVIGLLFMTWQQTVARAEYTRTYEKSFSINEGGTVNLHNIHGAIDVSTWAKNEVGISVTVRVMAGSDSKAEDVFDRISISFSNSSNHVSAETEIDSKKSFWWFTQSWWGEDDVKIDYEVFMPESANLELSNRYGNVDIEDIRGQSVIDLKYGDLTMDHAIGDLVLELAYGNATIAKSGESTVEIAYAKLRMNEVESMDIESKFSEITIGNITTLVSSSSYDKYYLGEVGTMDNEGKYDKIEAEKIDELVVETKYTNIRLEELVGTLDAELSYGGLDIDQISDGFTGIRVESKYTGIKIDVSDLEDFTFDINGRYTSVHLPSDVDVQRDIRNNNEIEVSGFKTRDGGSGEIVIDAEYGGVKLR